MRLVCALISGVSAQMTWPRNRFPDPMFVELDAHAIFSKFFGESGKQLVKLFQMLHQFLALPGAFLCIFLGTLFQWCDAYIGSNKAGGYRGVDRRSGDHIGVAEGGHGGL
mmetsp:Transcript_11761/g.33106  ORF Transcript_11761/g.33106 Transcript_11761/m.33106 type:complete len:110 (+) Transcript_11761:774-1103(+)